MGGIESLIGITDVTQVVTLFLFGTKYRLPLWELGIIGGIIARFITAIFAIGVPSTFSLGRNFLGTVLIAPVIEEIVFRLILLTVIFEFTGSVALAIFLSALLFGFAHMAYGAWRVPETFVGGLLLGVMFVNFGLLAVIIIHMTHNLFSRWGR